MKPFYFSVLTPLVLLLSSCMTPPAQAGSVRDGGDEPVTSPHWECANQDGSVQVKVSASARDIQVIGSENLVFEDAYLDTTAIMKPVLLVDDQHKELGATLQWKEIMDGTFVLAFSIYLEKRLESPVDNDNPQYEARVGLNWNGWKIHAEHLVCKRNQLAAHSDAVFHPDFE